MKFWFWWPIKRVYFWFCISKEPRPEPEIRTSTSMSWERKSSESSIRGWKNLAYTLVQQFYMFLSLKEVWVIPLKHLKHCSVVAKEFFCDGNQMSESRFVSIINFIPPSPRNQMYLARLWTWIFGSLAEAKVDLFQTSERSFETKENWVCSVFSNWVFSYAFLQYPCTITNPSFRTLSSMPPVNACDSS